MGDIGSAFAEAGRMIVAADGMLWGIVLLSLKVTLTAVAVATAIGLPLGAALAIRRFAGRNVLLVTLNALMGLPPVVVGLVVDFVVSRAGALDGVGVVWVPFTMTVG